MLITIVIPIFKLHIYNVTTCTFYKKTADYAGEVYWNLVTKNTINDDRL